MIVANRLTDGRVVFLAEDASWVESIDDGLLIESDDAGQALLERAQQAVADGVVVDAYAIEVLVEAGRRQPAQLREKIRAFGPTV